MDNLETQKAGIVAVVGRASVGKSTLVNALLGEKISIVSPIAQTTRNVVRGILTEPRGQLVLLDTPGVHKATYDLGKIMNRMARATAQGGDVVLLVLDTAQSPQQEDEGWIRRLVHEEIPCIIALNKCDKKGRYEAAYREIWTRVLEEKQVQKSTHWISVSGQTGAGIPELTTLLFDHLPVGPRLFSADVLTDYPRKLAIADVIREKYYSRLKEELPHAIAVWIENLNESEKGWNVDGYVYVNKPSQKGIVLGAKGHLLKGVTKESERELTELYEIPVKLTLWVKVEKNWAKNFWMLQKFGYA